MFLVSRSLFIWTAYALLCLRARRAAEDRTWLLACSRARALSRSAWDVAVGRPRSAELKYSKVAVLLLLLPFAVAVAVAILFFVVVVVVCQSCHCLSFCPKATDNLLSPVSIVCFVWLVWPVTVKCQVHDTNQKKVLVSLDVEDGVASGPTTHDPWAKSLRGRCHSVREKRNKKCLWRRGFVVSVVDVVVVLDSGRASANTDQVRGPFHADKRQDDLLSDPTVTWHRLIQ